MRIIRFIKATSKNGFANISTVRLFFLILNIGVMHVVFFVCAEGNWEFTATIGLDWNRFFSRLLCWSFKVFLIRLVDVYVSCHLGLDKQRGWKNIFGVFNKFFLIFKLFFNSNFFLNIVYWQISKQKAQKRDKLFSSKCFRFVTTVWAKCHRFFFCSHAMIPFIHIQTRKLNWCWIVNCEESYCVAKGLNEWVYGKVTNGFQFYCIFIATIPQKKREKREAFKGCK